MQQEVIIDRLRDLDDVSRFFRSRDWTKFRIPSERSDHLIGHCMILDTRWNNESRAENIQSDFPEEEIKTVMEKEEET